MIEYPSFSGREEKRIEAHLRKMWAEYELCGQKTRYCLYSHYTPIWHRPHLLNELIIFSHSTPNKNVNFLKILHIISGVRIEVFL